MSYYILVGCDVVRIYFNLNFLLFGLSRCFCLFVIVLFVNFFYNVFIEYVRYVFMVYVFYFII